MPRVSMVSELNASLFARESCGRGNGRPLSRPVRRWLDHAFVACQFFLHEDATLFRRVAHGLAKS